jgi:hypothetical protein
MFPIALIEIWEWLRGYRKWTETQAQTVFLKEETLFHEGGKDLHYSHVTGARLVWTDGHGGSHYALLKQYGDPPKYLLAEGETVDLRYNPANPMQFYCRKLFETKFRYYVSTAFTILAVAILCIGWEWIRSALGCSR